MKGLEHRQRDYLADFCAKIALMAAAALIFGQFIPGQEINILVLVVGILLTISAIAYGTYLRN